MIRGPLIAVASAMALVALPSCGGSLAPQRDAQCAPSRPAAWRTPLPGTWSAIKPRPETAVLCEYRYARLGQTKGVLVGQVVLRGAAADGVAAIASQGRTPEPWLGSCAGDPGGERGYTEVLRLGYRSGPPAAGLIAPGQCGGTEFVQGRRELILPSDAASIILSEASGTKGNAGPRTPAFTGLSLAGAEAAARLHGLSLRLSAVVTDSRVAPGTVIFQVPSAGEPSRVRNGSAVSIITATGRTAAACTAGQLRLAYRSDGARRGQSRAEIVIVNTGQAPCQLPGSAEVTGLGRSGEPVTKPVTITGSAVLEDSSLPLILSPGLPSVPDGRAPTYGLPAPLPGLTVGIYLDGAICRPGMVVPASWRISFGPGLSFTIRNADPASPTPPSPVGAFVTCGGRFESWLIYYGLYY